jgi:sugar/nucleoside kinase (ribokinase family)
MKEKWAVLCGWSNTGSKKILKFNMFQIIAIGNAITDIISEIDDSFLQENNLIKSSMSLIDEEKMRSLSIINPTKISSGGSAANTISALSQLGIKTGFIGKVGSDELGKSFVFDIEKTGSKFLSKNFSDEKSAVSFVLVTKDAKRTMCTFLGCASNIAESDIEEDFFSSAKILYLEGYLWDKPDTILALKKAISFAKKHNVKIAFSLSDSFCVSRHKLDFIRLIDDLDILFANEDEIKELLDLENIEDNNNEHKLLNFNNNNHNLITIITRSEKGCTIIKNNIFVKVEAEKIEKIVDTTGAGDCFSAGFLYGFISGWNLEKCGKNANLIAGKIIQKFGARI